MDAWSIFVLASSLFALGISVLICTLVYETVSKVRRINRMTDKDFIELQTRESQIAKQMAFHTTEGK